MVAIIVFGIIIVAILLAMLHQQKQNSPEGQEASYSKRIEESRDAESKQDANNEKLYAKKAAKMKGHVLDLDKGAYFTSWTKDDFLKWANDYLSRPVSERHTNMTVSYGTNAEKYGDADKNIKNNKGVEDYPLDEIAELIKNNNGELSNYYETVKDFNKKNPGVNPDDIR